MSYCYQRAALDAGFFWRCDLCTKTFLVGVRHSSVVGEVKRENEGGDTRMQRKDTGSQCTVRSLPFSLISCIVVQKAQKRHNIRNSYIPLSEIVDHF